MIIEDPEMRTRIDRTVAMVAAGIFAGRALWLLLRPMWFDEIFTLWLGRQSASRILEHLRMDSGPPGYYVAVAPFVRLAERTGADAMVRLPSLLAIAALFAAFGPRFSGGRRFPILLAASPLLFFYSTEARAYALLGSLSFALFLAAFRARDGGRSRAAVLLLAGALPWIHYLGAFVVLGSSLLCAIRRRWARLAFHVLGAGPFLLWLPAALAQPTAALDWNRMSISSFWRVLQPYGFWGGLPPYFAGWQPPLELAGAALGMLVLLGAIAASRRNRAIADAVAFSLVPIALAFAASGLRPVYFPGRTEMATLPVALWAFGRASRRSRIVSTSTAVACAAGLVMIAASVVRPAAEPGYSVTARVVSASAAAGDLVIASDADYLPLRLQKDRGRLKAPLLGIPEEIERHPGWFVPGKIMDPPSEGRRLIAALASHAQNRAILAIPPDPAARALVAPAIATRRAQVMRIPGGDSVLVAAPRRQ
jgi:hypothetical protein